MCLGNISDTICSHLIKSYGSKQIKLIEANPGPCLITKHILKNTDYKVFVYENSPNEFKEYLTVSTYIILITNYNLH